MSKEFFKNLPDTSTPLNSKRLNGLLNGNESMGSITVEDVKCKNLFNIRAVTWGQYAAFVEDGLWLDKGYEYNAFIKTINISGIDNLSISASCSTTFRISYAFLDANGSVLAGKYVSVPAIEHIFENIIVPTNAKEVVVSQIDASDGSDIKIQVESGDKVTDYSPHKFFGYASDVEEDLLTLKRSTMETVYLGNNPNIDELRYASGVYGLYGCTQAPNASIAVLEVLRYTQDWLVQRFTDVSSGEMWQRMFRNGTSWTEWIKRW